MTKGVESQIILLTFNLIFSFPKYTVIVNSQLFLFNLFRKASCLKGDTSLTDKGQLGAKKTKAELAFTDKTKQSGGKLIELEIFSSDDEL